jgi:L-ascorbate metabolism protein UlaG (beta-lactamase superfamily)
MTAHRPAPLALTPLGGPTVLVELGALRLLVDPTFDHAGDHPVGTRVLTKTADAPIDPDELGRIDAVLLSHDQHPDNLDRRGRELLATVPLVATTTAAAARLGAPARGLEPWDALTLGATTVTAVPAQHGPDGTEDLTGPVIGFLLTTAGALTVYVSGDNASLRVVGAVAARSPRIDVAVLFAGAARTPLVDGFLTLTSEQAVAAARILGRPRVLAAHTDGWAHFTEGADAFTAAFARAGLDDLLVDSTPGVRSIVDPADRRMMPSSTEVSAIP